MKVIVDPGITTPHTLTEAIEFLLYESGTVQPKEELELYVFKDSLKTELVVAELLELKGRLKLSIELISQEESELLQLTRELNAILLTSEPTLELKAKLLGLRAFLYQPKPELSFEKWFTEHTASLHIKPGVHIRRKVGTPGNWVLERVDEIPSERDIELLYQQMLLACRLRDDAYLEIERPYSTVMQIGKYRVLVSRPPVSDRTEITITAPLVKLPIEYYNLSGKVRNRLDWCAEGILIAGAPGHGKTTFAQALGEYYHSKGKIVKTIESPRDLQLNPEVTGYSKNFASSEELHDLLLLSRPDYVIFDEMRDTDDFLLYIDLRLAGVGMIGVIHATSPISAVSRFVNRIELGVLPQVVDTVLFIREGTLDKVLSLELTVKVPTGMRDQGLARPVIEVRDFETGELEYELYTFGEETVIAPVSSMTEEEYSEEELVIAELLEEEAKNLLKTDKVKVFVRGSRAVIWVPEKLRSKLIGRRGKRIERLENEFSLKIDVKGFK